MSTADERLDSHETRITNLEAERGDHSRKLIEHESRIARVEQVQRTLTDGVAKANDTANRALRAVDELKEAHAVLERALMRAVDKVAVGMQEHLKKQDAVLEQQNQVLASMHAGLSRLVKKADDEDVIAAADRRRAERLAWWVKFIAGVGAAAGVVGGAIHLLLSKG